MDEYLTQRESLGYLNLQLSPKRMGTSVGSWEAELKLKEQVKRTQKNP